MGMSTHVIGFRPPDAEWKKMKAIWDACAKAEIDPPDAVATFFDGEPPDDAGVHVELEGTPACREWREETEEGYEIDVTKLPAGLKIIRFYNSY